MIKFSIPPEYCLVVNAFTQASTLRGAATLLGTDPAALVRKVQRLTSEFGYLQKVGNRWTVTESGRRVAQWTEEFMVSQKKLMDETPRIRISAFSWLTEEMLIPELAKLEAICGLDYAWSFKMIAADLEQELLQNRSDFVITGHAPNDPSIAHRKLSTYDWTVITPYSWKKAIPTNNQKQLVEFLNSKPFIGHMQMGAEKIFDFRPSTSAQILVDGVIGLRSAVASELGWSAVPAMSVRSFVEDNKIIKLSIPVKIRDQVSVWWLRSRKDTQALAPSICKWVSQFEVN